MRYPGMGITCAPRSCSRGWPWRSWSRAGRCRCGWWSSAPSLWTAPSSRSSPRTPWWAASWSDRTPCIAATPCTALSHLLGVCPVPGVVAPRVIPGVTLETVDCVPSCKRRIFKVRNKNPPSTTSTITWSWQNEPVFWTSVATFLTVLQFYIIHSPTASQWRGMEKAVN